MLQEPVIATSARRHGVSDKDMLHAYRNPIRVFELDDGLTMIVGANHAAVLFELGVVASVQSAVIVHAMRVRPKFLR